MDEYIVAEHVMCKLSWHKHLQLTCV